MVTGALDIFAELDLSERLRQSDLHGFKAEAVPHLALARSCHGHWAFLARDRVVFDGAGKFEFIRYMRDNSGAQNAYVLAVFDEFAEPADILAFRPGGPAAIWLGRVAVAGQEQVYMPRFDEALDVHATVLDWLKADRDGIVLLHSSRAAERLRGITLRAATAEHRRRLRAALAPPAPTILVRQADHREVSAA